MILIVATVTTVIIVRTNVEQIRATEVPAPLSVLANEQQPTSTDRVSPAVVEIPDSPIDAILVATDPKSAAPMPADQVEWEEVPYPEETRRNVFTGFGSENLEAQTEVENMFDELLEDFVLQAQSIDRYAAEN
tara:strand:+ start:11850 stop:12248 length:399 start_codon:yes stop_codon:yes gene_type:complete